MAEPTTVVQPFVDIVNNELELDRSPIRISAKCGAVMYTLHEGEPDGEGPSVQVVTGLRLQHTRLPLEAVAVSWETSGIVYLMTSGHKLAEVEWSGGA